MSTKTPAYRLLPGQRYADMGTLGAASKLWTADDHLLLVTETMISEEYKRFYFQDIQALIVRETKQRQAWNIFYGAIVALIFAWTFLLGGVDEWRVGLFISSPFLLIMAINSGLGPMCTFHIRTAVQTERVSALRRMRPVRKAIAEISLVVAPVQGTLAAEEMEAIEVHAPAKAAVEKKPAHAAKKLDLQIISGFCAALLINGIWPWAAERLLMLTGSSWFTINTVLFMSALLISVVVLIRQYSGFRDRPILAIAWCAAVFFIMFGVINYFYSMALAVADAQALLAKVERGEQLTLYTATVPGFTLANLIVSSILGLFGLLRLRTLVEAGVFGGAARPFSRVTEPSEQEPPAPEPLITEPVAPDPFASETPTPVPPPPGSPES